MALSFPSNTTDYLGKLKFINVDGGDHIDLYLPASLQIGDKVEYENVGLTALFAAGADVASGEKSFDQLTGPSWDTFSKLAVNKAVSAFSDAAGAAARSATRTAPNPNTRAIFKQVNLRSFQFTFKMIPNNIGEARDIGAIIKEFRKNMYPERIDGGIAYKFPNRYRLEAHYNDMVLSDYNLTTEPCFLESVMSNYNPSSQAFMVPGGSKQGFFSEIDLSLTFIEGRTLDRTSVFAGL